MSAVGEEMTRAVLVHLRRPSKFSTIGPGGHAAVRRSRRAATRSATTATSRTTTALRKAYREAGRIKGKADTEVGARWLEDEWTGNGAAPAALQRLHETFGGHANLAVLTREGEAHHYAGNDENPVFAFDLGEVRVVSTGMYSLDRSVFKYVVPEATNRKLVPLSRTASL